MKEEIQDLSAVLEAISNKDSFEGTKFKLQAKLKSNQSDLQKLNSGKSTFATMFKSSQGKASTITNLQTQSAQVEKDIDCVDQLLKIMVVYLDVQVIKLFKKEKIENYFTMLKEFSEAETKNSSELFQCWSVFLNQIKESVS